MTRSNLLTELQTLVEELGRLARYLPSESFVELQPEDARVCEKVRGSIDQLRDRVRDRIIAADLAQLKHQKHERNASCP